MPFDYGLPSPRSQQLDETKAVAWLQELNRVWGYDGGYWFPLSKPNRDDLIAFQSPYFRRALANRLLREMIRRNGTLIIREYREGRTLYELPVDYFDPDYDGREGFWTDQTLSWAIYSSHESSITIGGTWLVEEVKNSWPEWKDFVWTTPFF